MRTGLRAAALVLLAAATTGCCVLSPVVSVCAPGGYGGGPAGRHGGRHLLGTAPPPVSEVAAVASVETVALAPMYAAAAADTVPRAR